jgi:hypothetical protein
MAPVSLSLLPKERQMRKLIAFLLCTASAYGQFGIGSNDAKKIRGFSVCADAPASGEALVFDGSCYRPSAAGGGGGLVTATGTLDFGAIADGTCADLTFAATGFATGTAVVLGVPAGLSPGLAPEAFISATDTAKVRLCNFTGGSTDPPSGTYRVTAITSAVTATATVDFASMVDGGCNDQTMTLAGAAVGNSIALGRPAASEAGLHVIGFISATNTVTLRACNWSGATLDPAPATYRATSN